ncbi:hypothetical protein HJFPF1_00588 [Paramyrothecium foliicola]|nr:hypothetical protein HJFPF1_00588 [Paramyrothecium foliicola]
MAVMAGNLDPQSSPVPRKLPCRQPSFDAQVVRQHLEVVTAIRSRSVIPYDTAITTPSCISPSDLGNQYKVNWFSRRSHKGPTFPHSLVPSPDEM